MQLQTAIKLPPSPPIPLEYGMPIVSIGSCFSELIGAHLGAMGHRVQVSPFGIQYNPLSIARSIARLLSAEPYEVADLVEHDGLYHSLDHHGIYSSACPKQTLERINGDMLRGAEMLGKAQYLLLTWGTAYVYHLREDGRVVSNCHKLPERAFERQLASVDALLEPWHALLDELLRRNPSLHIVQTVSPIRHLRDGAHGNQLSKSTLHLFSHELQTLYPERIHYFPAYEIVMDELRDYRFYAEDMLHPSEQTARFIASRFGSWLCSPANQEAMQHLARLRAEYLHRPLHPDHPENDLRREQLLVRIRAFQRQFASADLSAWFHD